MTNPSCFLRSLHILSLMTLTLAPTIGSAEIYTVGASGVPENCSFPTIQEAINAAKNNPGRDEVWITRDVTGGGPDWTNLRLTIENDMEGIRLLGGLDDCWDQQPEGVTVLDGGVGPQLPVIDITENSNVEIDFLHVRRSNGSYGIRFNGHGTLSIHRSRVSQADAYGIHVLASGGHVNATLDDVLIDDNPGFGIYLTGSGSNARVVMGIISGSSVTTSSTGISVFGHTSLTLSNAYIHHNRNSGIHSTGGFVWIRGGSIFENEGGDGAGIKLEYDASRGGGHLHIYAGAHVVDNTAAGVGGGIHATSIDGIPSSPLVCLEDAVLSGNQARGGSGGALSIVGESLRAEWNTDCMTPQITCPVGQVCNVVSRNATRPSDDGFADGPTIRIGRGASADFRNLLIEGNTGTSLFAIDSQTQEQGHLRLDTSVVRGNYVGVDAIFWALPNTGITRISNSTILDNHVSPGGVIFRKESGLPMRLENTLVVQPNVPFASQLSILSPYGVLTLPGSLYPQHAALPILQAVPVLNDDLGRLALDSPGVDMGSCLAEALTLVDYIGTLRDEDIPGVGNGGDCVRDIGAFEAIMPVDHIFAGDFERIF